MKECPDCRRARPVKLFVMLGLLACGTDALRPETLAFEGVAITVGDPLRGETIESGVLLVRDGLIVAAGLEGPGPGAVEVPAGARVIDASGLHAIPAFIDAGTAAGLPRSAPASRNEGASVDFRDGPAPRTPAGHRRGVTPEHSALERVRLEDAIFDRHRRAGFAAVHLVPPEGYLAGSGAVIALSGAPLRRVVLRSSTGIAASFSGASGGHGYPRSLMGAIAHLRQTLLDARHHARWQATHVESPRGLRRAPRDTALDALEAVLQRRTPLHFRAESASQVQRALDLAAEFGARTTILGGHDATRAVGRLLRAGAAVVLTPQAATRPQSSTRPGSLPPRVQAERLERWRERAAAARNLAEQGVRVAFGTGDAPDPKKLIQSVHAAIGEGLPVPLALRQLTLGAAELLGIDHLVGSIEPGKVASVTFLDRAFGDEEARVRYLLADGELFDFEPPATGGEKGEEKEGEAPESGGATEEPTESRKPGAEIGEASGEEEKREKEKTGAGALVTDCELDQDRRPTLETGGSLFIRDARVITVAGTTHERASIRIRDGKIEAVGPDVGPDGVEAVIDASGWTVIPGIIDCHSHMAIDGGVNESSESITCEVRIGDVIDPRDITIYRALAGGTTAAHLLHGSANVIGGQCALIKLKYGRPVEELRVEGIPTTVKFALGENVKQSNFPARRGSRFPVTRMGVEAVLRRAFVAAREYRRSWEEHAARLARGERSLEPRRDLRLETLLRVLGGDIVVHCHSYRADEILMLMRVAEEFGFRVGTFQHVLEGYKVAPEIAAHGAGASAFSDWWAYKFEVIDAIPYNGAIMTRAGVVVSFNSDSDELVRHLNHEAAKGVKYGGLSEDEALRLVTLNAARQLHVDHRLGTIEPGKDADLAIFDAHPLSVYARCRYTIIEGEVYFERRGGGHRNRMAGRPLVGPEDFLPERVPENPRAIYAIRGARIVPVDGSPLDRGTIVIAKGRIERVGPVDDVEVPEGATVLEAEGLQVYPGLIDAGSRLGLVEINSVRGSVDLGETGSIQPDLRLASAVNVHSELIPVARAGGITTSAIFNNSQGVVAGQAAVIRLAGMSTPEAVLLDRLGLQVNVGGAKRPGDDGEPPEDPEWVEELERTFERARRYGEAIAAGESLAVDTRLSALQSYVRKELPVIFTANREPDIRLAIRLAADLDVRAILRGARDAWKVSDLLKEREIPVIVGPVLALPSERHDPYDAPYQNASRLHEAGVRIAFQSDDESNCRNLPFSVGTAVAFGLPHEAALRALTLGAAEILGLGEERGSITAGKVADLIVTDGDPLEIRTHVRHVFIAGRPVSLETRHTRLYRTFRGRTTLPQARAKQEF